MGGKTESIQIAKGLSLYKQPKSPGRGSPYWYARVYMPFDGRPLHVKSTGTTDERLATRIAEDFWADCILRRREIELNPAAAAASQIRDAVRFDRVGDDWLGQKKREAGTDERRLRAYKDSYHAFMGRTGFAAFFGHDDVRTITTDRIREYLVFQEERSAKSTLASSTKLRTLAILADMLRHARDKSLLQAIPPLPKVRLVDNPRAYFTREEYRRLYITAWVLAREARTEGRPDDQSMWMEVADFVIFMVHTFLRPGEWAPIRHQHIEIVRGATPYLRIAVTHGKTRKRLAVSMPKAVAAYQRIRARTGSAPTTYLFRPDYPNRQTAKERMADAFNLLMKRAGVTVDPFGKKRSPYSLRHSALMFAIGDNPSITLLSLAKNAGTSIDQLERFYLSHMPPEMHFANLNIGGEIGG